MPRLLFVLAFAALGLTVYALVDCLRTDKRLTRGLPKPVWIAVIVLLPILGPVAWLLGGRHRGWHDGGRPTRTISPDDDPEFLRALDEAKRQRESDEQMMTSWEDDLKRREQELRGDEDPPRA